MSSSYKLWVLELGTPQNPQISVCGGATNLSHCMRPEQGSNTYQNMYDFKIKSCFVEHHRIFTKATDSRLLKLQKPLYHSLKI